MPQAVGSALWTDVQQAVQRFNRLQPDSAADRGSAPNFRIATIAPVDELDGWAASTRDWSRTAKPRRGPRPAGNRGSAAE